MSARKTVFSKSALDESRSRVRTLQELRLRGVRRQGDWGESGGMAKGGLDVGGGMAKDGLGVGWR